MKGLVIHLNLKLMEKNKSITSMFIREPQLVIIVECTLAGLIVARDQLSLLVLLLQPGAEMVEEWFLKA